MMASNTYSREGYDPEWLALEDASGGRWWFGNDLENDIVAFNKNFSLLATLWPTPQEPLNIFDKNVKLSSHEVKYRIYQPESPTPLPILVFFHGGGFVAGNLDTEEPQCKIFAAKVPCVVVGVEYPLAPQNKLDTIIHTAVEAVSDISKNAQDINGNPEKLILIGGSAGGALSAMVAYQFTSILKDYKTIFGCVLLYPVLGNWNYNGKYRERYQAWEEMAYGDQPVLNRRHWESVSDIWGIDHHAARHYILFDEDLSHFPPTYVVNAEKEIARDDGLLLKLRLEDEGVRCRFKLYSGLPHWFHAFPQLSMAHVMVDDTVKGIQWLLSGDVA